MATLDVIENAEWKEHFNPHDGVGVNVYQVGQMLPRAGGHKIHSTLIISRDGPHQHFKVYFVKLCLILCPVGPSNPCITFRDIYESTLNTLKLSFIKNQQKYSKVGLF